MTGFGVNKSGNCGNNEDSGATVSKPAMLEVAEQLGHCDSKCSSSIHFAPLTLKATMTLYLWHDSTHHQHICLFVTDVFERYSEHPGPGHQSLLKAICHQMVSFPDGADAAAAGDPHQLLHLACCRHGCHVFAVGVAY